MINLLPTKEKGELILEKEKKLAIILGSAVLIAIIFMALVLLSVKFYILGGVVSQKFALEQTEIRYKTEDFILYKTLLENYNKRFVKLESFYKDRTEFAPALKAVLDVKLSAGVYFTELSLKRKSDGKIEAKLYGISDIRNNLLIFKQNIESAKAIKNPNFSPESWINSKNINFYLTFEIDG